MEKFTAPLSVLLQRNQELFAGKKVIFAGEIDDASLLHFAVPSAEATVIVRDFTVAQKMAAMLGQSFTGLPGETIDYKHVHLMYGTAALAQSGHSADVICLLLSKSKGATATELAYLTPRLEHNEHSLVLLAGSNAAGGKSADKLLKGHGEVSKLDLARKCTLFALNPDFEQPFALPELALHLNQEQSALLSRAAQSKTLSALQEALQQSALSADALLSANKALQVQLPAGIAYTAGKDKQTDLRLLQDCAVFSTGKVDTGTWRMLECLKDVKAQGQALDLCCGCGVVGLVLAQAGYTVSACDLDAAALLLTMLNFHINRQKLQHLQASDMLSDMAGRTFDLIAVNPPFHKGLQKVSTPAEALFSQASDCLSPAGELLVVGNTFLQYEGQAAKAGYRPEILHKDGAFTVIKMPKMS